MYTEQCCTVYTLDSTAVWDKGTEGEDFKAWVHLPQCAQHIVSLNFIAARSFESTILKIFLTNWVLAFFSKKVPFRGTGTTKPEPEMGLDELMGTGVSTTQKIIQKPAGVW